MGSLLGFLAAPVNACETLEEEMMLRTTMRFANFFIQHGHVLFCPVAHDITIADICQIGQNEPARANLHFHATEMLSKHADYMILLEFQDWVNDDQMRAAHTIAERQKIPMFRIRADHELDNVLIKQFENFLRNIKTPHVSTPASC